MLEAQDPQGSLVGVTLGNYRVTDRIGAGGMGVVYRAQDLRLGRVVAVKALPHAAESDPDGRRKLMNEARRASRVVSPYVATVFDVVEQDDSAYIVMEYIEGRRLDDVLRHDRPGVALVTGYAIEIAEALTAIHSAGLVHRDLKPANVMVTPAGHVKVMDFGLAREDAAALLREAGAESTQSTQTAPGVIAGTILYMSPEQVRGEPLDARSDLFSFGTLLHEAVTGKHPFERESILASASAILNEPPAGAAQLSQPGSSPVGGIVQRLLEKDRDRRYLSAELALTDLRAAQSGTAVAKVADQASGRRRFWRLATAAAALATLALVTWMFGLSRPPIGANGARPVLAVLPFEDRTGEPRGDLRGELLAELLAADLAESTLVRPIASDRIRDVLAGIDAAATRPQTITAIERATAPRWIVAGTLFKEGDAFYAMVSIYRPGVAEPSDSFRAAARETGAIAEIAGVKLRERLFPGSTAEAGSTRAQTARGSTSEEALLLEQEAKRALRERRYRNAIDGLDRAVRLDPGFLAAQMRLADVLDWAGYSTRAGETADRAMRIVERTGGAARNDAIALEARAIRARIYGDVDAEIAARRGLVARHRDDPAAHRALAYTLGVSGQVAEALPEIDLAIDLDPKDPGGFLTKARLLVKVKRMDEAVAALERAGTLSAELGSPAGLAAIERARADFDYARGSYPQAAEAFARAGRAYDSAGLGVLAAQCRKGAGDCTLMQGKLDAAAVIYDDVLATARSVGDHRTIVNTLNSLGARFLFEGANEKAERLLREAHDDASGLGNPRLVAETSLNLASALVNLGRGAEGRALAEEALAAARNTADFEIQSKALMLLASVGFREGHLEDAARSYRELRDTPSLADAPGTPLGNIHLALSEISRTMGRLQEAATSADAAIAVNRAAHQPVLLGYALVSRARIRAALGLEAGAEQDLDEAAKLASQPGGALDELRQVVELGRAELAAARSRWNDAERILASLRKQTGAVVDADVFTLSAEVAIESGRIQDGLRHARAAGSVSTASVVERTRSRVVSARAFAAASMREEADTEARRALDEADRMGLPLEAARASAVLLDLPGAADAEAIRAKGRAAWDRYLDAAPEAQRAAVRARGDLQSLIRALETKAPSSHAR